MKQNSVTAVVEKWILPAYPSPVPEEMPMYAETRQHQGTSGNPYPNRVVPKVDRSSRKEREYTVVRLENDYIRVAVLPEFGGRVFEAYDKKTDYNFLYRQHVIKPALIAAYGSWIAGGIEFNWPFHHRPSTFMPVDFELVKNEDGSAIVWLSECDPTDRTRGTVGIALRPDKSYFETRVRLSNRTPLEHPFLWWESAGIHVNEDYQLVFPEDVTWAHHHYDRSHTTFPIAHGQYGAEVFDKPTDISYNKNVRTANSIFAAPSKFDFFGGYDHRRDCGILHIANHHVSPGKKMFTWGYGHFADNWRLAITDDDGPHAELMAGSYTDDQPDFTWLMPYETKSFSQYWYPTHLLKAATYADLGGAFSIDLKGNDSRIRLISTGVVENGCLTVECGGKTVLKETINISPSECLEFPLSLGDEKYRVVFSGSDGEVILDYTKYTSDYVHIPKDNKGIPTPAELKTPQELCIAGHHIDQYRDPITKPDAYYLAALAKDPDFLPALTGMANYLYRTAHYDNALRYADKAIAVRDIYNQNPIDGNATYLKGLILFALERYDEAYDVFYKAAWSANAISKAMTFVSAIDGRRGDYAKMLAHAEEAIEKEALHPIAGVYASLALYKLGKTESALVRLEKLLSRDPLNQLARYSKVLISGKCEAAFFDGLSSDASETCIDTALDLIDAGFYAEAISLFEALPKYRKPSPLSLYILAVCYDKQGCEDKAVSARALASRDTIVIKFPYRLGEIVALKAAIQANDSDGNAHYLLGCVLYDKAHYKEAEKHWLRAVELLPDFYIPYRNLAVAYYSHLGSKEKALPYLKEAIKLHSNDEQLINEISFVMANLGIPADERVKYLLDNRPLAPSDDFVLELVKAYNAAGNYEAGLCEMLAHSFTPSEGGEFAVADPYMFGRFAPGRLALCGGDNEKALSYFESITKIPENLHAGFWNASVLVPYEYFRAEALLKLGRKAEAEEVMNGIKKIDNRGMWNMGGEFTYYSAMTYKLSGDTMTGNEIMRSAILAWEEELASGGGGYRASTPFYLSYINNAEEEKLAALYYMLGFGKLYFGDVVAAKVLFEKSLRLNPNNVKCALELKFI